MTTLIIVFIKLNISIVLQRRRENIENITVTYETYIFSATCSHPFLLNIGNILLCKMWESKKCLFTMLGICPTLHASGSLCSKEHHVMIRHMSCFVGITWAEHCSVTEENMRLQHNPLRRKKLLQPFDFLPRWRVKEHKDFCKQHIVLCAVGQLTGQPNLWLHWSTV